MSPEKISQFFARRDDFWLRHDFALSPLIMPKMG